MHHQEYMRALRVLHGCKNTFPKYQHYFDAVNNALLDDVLDRSEAEEYLVGVLEVMFDAKKYGAAELLLNDIKGDFPLKPYFTQKLQTAKAEFEEKHSEDGVAPIDEIQN